MQDEFPNYGANVQESTTYTLQGDTTWHMQPQTSTSFVVNITGDILGSSISSSTSNSSENNEGGLREESIEHKQQSTKSSVSSASSSKGPVVEEPLHPAPDPALAFAPNDPHIRLFTGYEGQSSSTKAYYKSSANEAASQHTASSTGVDESEYCIEPLHGAADTKPVVYIVDQHDHFHWYHWLCDVLLLFTIIAMLAVIVCMHVKVKALEERLEKKPKTPRKTISVTKRTVTK